MHSNPSELKPIEVFQSISRLILEGRTLNQSPKGFGEGVHCFHYFHSTTKVHTCTPDNPVCVRDQSLQTHLSLLYDNSIPLVIEVLLGPNCSCAVEKCNSLEISPEPDSSFILLEQWTISTYHIQQKQINEIKAGRSSALTSMINGNRLLQIVRSHLHFSQLSAWLSLSKGEKPKNLIYRVTMPGEDFGSMFSTSTKIVYHEFPTAIVKDCAIKVQVKTLPRSEVVPIDLCSNPLCSIMLEGARPGKVSPIIFHSTVEDKDGTNDIDNHEIQVQSQSQNSRNSPSPVGWVNVNEEPIQQKFSNLTVTNNCRMLEKLNSAKGVETDATPFCRHSTQFKRKDLMLQTENLTLPTRTPCSNSNTNQNDINTNDEESESSTSGHSTSNKPIIPSLHEKLKFRKSLDSATALIFHGKTGLPLTSSPAPYRKGQRFDFDSSLTSSAQISSSIKHFFHAQRLSETSQLLGSFEECVLNGRIEPVSTIEGFSAEIGASGSFCPQHLHLPVTVFFYTFCDNDKVSAPYLAHINVGKKGYAIPRKGTLQVTLFNPLRTVVKMFVVMYDFSDMPHNSRTFLRQRILYMPIGSDETNEDAQKWLRYLIHLRIASSRSGKIYLHTDIRIMIFRKSDADTAMGHKSPVPHELRSFTYAPKNPKYSPRISSASLGVGVGSVSPGSCLKVRRERKRSTSSSKSFSSPSSNHDSLNNVNVDEYDGPKSTVAFTV